MPEEKLLQPEVVRAFNLGSDARIAGLPLTACPYPSAVEAKAWRSGFHDAEDHWGDKDWVRGRWHVRPLIGRKANARS